MSERPEGKLPPTSSLDAMENPAPPELPTRSPLFVWARINIGLPVGYSLISILLALGAKASAFIQTLLLLWGFGGGFLLIVLLAVLNIRACRPFAGGRIWLVALLALGSIQLGLGIAAAGCGLSVLAMDTFS